MKPIWTNLKISKKKIAECNTCGSLFMEQNTFEDYDDEEKGVEVAEKETEILVNPGL